MVWCAFLYAAAGSWLSWLVGRPLIPLNAERYAREADLRFALVRINQHADGIALYGGEADEKEHVGRALDAVLAVMRRLVTGLTRLTWVTAGYGWLAIVAPILAASPGYFGGDLTLGGLMVAAGAFTQVQQSLRWFVDNFNTIADWLATLRRVAWFRRALVDMDKPVGEIGRIERAPAADEKITFDNISVAFPGGAGRLEAAHLEIAPGDRVLVTGEPGAGLTRLFLAVAGLWRWGSGRIGAPASADVAFMPRRPYAPPGALRDAVAYPLPASAFDDEQMAAAFARVGLQRLSPQLDRSANWDNALSGDEAQRLAFARLLLRKPRFVCLDDAAEADEESRKTLLSLFDQELAGTGVVSFGRRDLREGFSTRVVRVVKIPEKSA